MDRSDYTQVDIDEMEQAFDESVSELRRALKSVASSRSASVLRKSFSSRAAAKKGRYSSNERNDILRQSYQLLKGAEITPVLATKIEGRLNSNMPLSDEMNLALGRTVADEEEVTIVSTLKMGLDGVLIPREKRQFVKEVALEKSMDGEIDSVMLTKIEARMNRGLPLTVEMIKALDFDVEIHGELSKALDEDGEVMPLSEKSGRTQIFSNYEGDLVEVSNEEMYAKVQKAVQAGKISPLDVTKIESRVNRGERMPEQFLRSLFLE